MSCSNKIRNFLDSVRDSPRGEDLVAAIFFAQIVEGLSASACKGRSPAKTVRNELRYRPGFARNLGGCLALRESLFDHHIGAQVLPRWRITRIKASPAVELEVGACELLHI